MVLVEQVDLDGGIVPSVGDKVAKHVSGHNLEELGDTSSCLHREGGHRVRTLRREDFT
jgi:hypothetical protein